MGLDYKICYKYNTRSRPELFKTTLQRYYDYMDNKTDFQFAVTADTNDSTMNNPEIIQFVNDHTNASITFGVSTSKISSVNNDVPTNDWDIIVLVSDDMIPQIQGFDNIIRNDMKKYYADLNGLLWYWDGRTKAICTLTIMGRTMYDYFGHLYHPVFITHYADDFLTLVTEDKQQFIDKCIIKHEWCLHNNDALMRKCESQELTSKDRRHYRRMKRRWNKDKNYNLIRNYPL